MKVISSIQNPLIREIIQLREKSRKRKQSGKFLVEGQRELSLALSGDYEFTTILFNAGIIGLDKVESLIGFAKSSPEIIEVSDDVYEKMSYRQSTEGIIGIALSKTHLLSDLEFSTKTPLILIAEAPEKPGNIGALLRTADAANLDAVIIANPKTDLYNPNIIRSGVGCLFTRQVATGTTSEIIDFLKSRNIYIYCAALTASKPYHEIEYSEATAIVVGTEHDGLTETWLNASDQNIIIPMQGTIDSMNVSVSAAIIIFEAKRQRKFL
ncbi:TrmH family RNA methyltransferase [Robertkochia solimangrovi]|uniref:TrmH family RNA methyltransferase n=1 Tax=Robertkochia solimangrovi TaxID=2213046 RepID=UPI00117C2BC9|nr:RNA methyltransferase [Robertkochia solimangrovi]TRZ43605.1 RNA methyltransferase [Robertkochia solimangrovi]